MGLFHASQARDSLVGARQRMNMEVREAPQPHDAPHPREAPQPRDSLIDTRQRLNTESIGLEAPQPRDSLIGARQRINTDSVGLREASRRPAAAAPTVPRLPFELPKAQMVFLERLDTLIGRISGDRGSALALRIVRSAIFSWVTVVLTAVPLLFNTMLVVTSTLYNEATTDTGVQSATARRLMKGGASNVGNLSYDYSSYLSNISDSNDESRTLAFAWSFFGFWWEIETTYVIFVSLVWSILVIFIVMTMNAPAAKRAFGSFNGLFSLYNLLRWFYAFVCCSAFSPGVTTTLLLFSTGGTVLWCAADALQTRRSLQIYLGCWLCLHYMSLITLSLLRFRFREGDLLYGVGLTLGVSMSAVDVHVQAAFTLMLFIAKDCALELRHPGMCSVVRVGVKRQWIVNGKIDDDDEYADDPAAAVVLQEKLHRMQEEQSKAAAIFDPSTANGARKRTVGKGTKTEGKRRLPRRLGHAQMLPPNASKKKPRPGHTIV